MELKLTLGEDAWQKAVIPQPCPYRFGSVVSLESHAIDDSLLHVQLNFVLFPSTEFTREMESL
jgi:hypothetical protein